MLNKDKMIHGGTRVKFPNAAPKSSQDQPSCPRRGVCTPCPSSYKTLFKLRKMTLRLGRKHMELAVKWMPTAMTYGTGASLALLYFTDWKAVLQYVPFYSGKFQE